MAAAVQLQLCSVAYLVLITYTHVRARTYARTYARTHFNITACNASQPDTRTHRSRLQERSVGYWQGFFESFGSFNH